MTTMNAIVEPLLKYQKRRFIKPISKYRGGKEYTLHEVRAKKYVMGHYAVIENE